MSATPDNLDPVLAELLSAYLDDALSADERARVVAALQNSPAAQKRLAELRTVSHLVAGLPREAAPASFLNDIKRRMLAEGVLEKGHAGSAAAPKKTPTQKIAPETSAAPSLTLVAPKRRAGLWAAAAALVVGVAVLTFMLPRLRDGDRANDGNNNAVATLRDDAPAKIMSESKEVSAASEPAAGAAPKSAPAMVLKDRELLALVNDSDLRVGRQAVSLSYGETLARANAFANNLQFRTLTAAGLDEQNFQRTLDRVESASENAPDRSEHIRNSGLGGGAGGGDALAKRREGTEADKRLEKNTGAQAPVAPANETEESQGANKDAKKVEAFLDTAKSPTAPAARLSTLRAEDSDDAVVGVVIEGDLEEVALALANLGVTELASISRARPAAPESNSQRDAFDKALPAKEKQASAPQDQAAPLVEQFARLREQADERVRRDGVDNADRWGAAKSEADGAREVGKPVKEEAELDKASDQQPEEAKHNSRARIIGSKDDKPEAKKTDGLKNELRKSDGKNSELKDDESEKSSESEHGFGDLIETASRPAARSPSDSARTTEKTLEERSQSIKGSAGYLKLLAELQALAASQAAELEARGESAERANAPKQAPARVRVVIPVKR